MDFHSQLQNRKKASEISAISGRFCPNGLSAKKKSLSGFEAM
jgi:hypothetical protein